MTRARAFVSLFVVSLFAASLAVSAPAAAAPVPEGATWHQEWFPSEDGTMLRADVLLPADRADGDRHPVILSIGPYFGRNALNMGVGEDGPVDRFGDMVEGGHIFERGYAYVQVDSRGYGGSDGCNDFGGRGEQMDTEAAVNWAASQDWSNGRVGMWGKSYDAWTQVMALAENPVGLKAAVIQSPLIEAYRGMFMNGVHYDAGWYATPSLYTGYDLAPSTPGDPAPEEYLYPAKGTATNPDCYAEKTAMTAVPEYDIPYWQERNIVNLAGRSDVPVLWSHGMNDVNTKPSNFMPVWTRLEGPKRAWFGQWDHVRGNEANLVGRDGFLDEAMDWFDHFLKGEPLVEHPGTEIQDVTGQWRTEKAWPPEDGVRAAFPLQTGSYPDDMGSSASNPSDGVWTVTPPAPHDLRYAGEPELTVEVETQVPFANLIAVLYDIAPDGTAHMISRGAYRLPGNGEVGFVLYPQDGILEEGHRLGLHISGDDSHFQPTWTQTDVTVTGGSLSLPFLTYERVYDLEGGPARAMTGVPQASVDQGTIEAAEVDFDFPPPMIACDDETQDCPQE